ncbi:MAG TPA: hypothetical protein VF870_08715, partial [Ignavibacteriaceae bacterium]
MTFEEFVKPKYGDKVAFNELESYHTLKKVEYYLIVLNEQYSPEKTEEDYRLFLQSITNDSNLIDTILKAWTKVLASLERED